MAAVLVNDWHKLMRERGQETDPRFTPTLEQADEVFRRSRYVREAA